MIAHLKDRVAALAALGWTGDDAEWLAFVCLHSGVFLRSQYLSFVGSLYSSTALRFIERCGDIAIEEAWNGTALKLCRITARPVYRALGAEHIRHRRRAASAGLLVRRLLAFDYVVDHPDHAWLPTEDDKVATLTTAGVPERTLPRRVYTPEKGRGQTRYFVNKLPVAVSDKGSVFVYVHMGSDSEAALRTWGSSHADLWAALHTKGRTVSVVVVGVDHDPFTGVDKVLAEWTAQRPGRAATTTERAEYVALGAAIEAADESGFERYGGSLEALTRYGELKRLVAVSGERVAGNGAGGGPRIASGALWRSARVFP